MNLRYKFCFIVYLITKKNCEKVPTILKKNRFCNGIIKLTRKASFCKVNEKSLQTASKIYQGIYLFL